MHNGFEHDPSIGFYSWNYLFNNIHSAASDIIVHLELNWDP